jgi:hypothetical protein
MDEKMVDQMFRRISSLVLTLIIVLAFATPGWAPPSRPEINVQGNDGQVPPTWTDIPHQDVTPTTAKGTDFGNAFFGVNVDHTFKIQNTGTADLTLDGTPPDYVVIGGTNPADFTVTLQPTTPVAQSGETTFTIRFNTSTEGLRQATVTIPNNDNNEDPYTFTIQGTGVAGAPEINVTGNGQTILSGDINPELADGTLFLDTGVGSTRDQDFVIQNTGDADLDLTGAPLVEITGINPGDFTVTLQPSTPVGAGLSETFTVQFNPQAGGLRTATVNIANNDTTGSAPRAWPTLRTPPRRYVVTSPPPVVRTPMKGAFTGAILPDSPRPARAPRSLRHLVLT